MKKFDTFQKIALTLIALLVISVTAFGFYLANQPPCAEPTFAMVTPTPVPFPDKIALPEGHRFVQVTYNQSAIMVVTAKPKFTGGPNTYYMRYCYTVTGTCDEKVIELIEKDFND